MIVEQRTYTVKAGATPIYMKHYQEEGFAIQGKILGNLIGWYYTDFGPLNQIVHMWGYENYADREARRKALGADPDWQAFLKKILPLILAQESKTMIPAPWSPEMAGK